MTHQTQITLEDVPTLNRSELKKLFSDVYNTPPPTRASHSFLSSNIAYRLQEQETGELSGRIKARLLKIAKELERDLTYSPVPDQPVKPGTRLIRTWQGDTHEVTVLDEGYEYRSQRYRSLSKIAFVITGTKWSGPAFFGLKQRRLGN